MVFTRSISFMTSVIALSSSTLAISLQSRHGGRSHQGAHDAAGPAHQPRQLNGPVGGILPLSSKTAIIPATMPINAPTNSGSTSLLSPEHISSLPTIVSDMNGELNAYIFPSSIIQVPIATICPDTPVTLPNVTAGHRLVNATASPPNGSSTIYRSSTVLGVPLPSTMTVCYPDSDRNCPSGLDSYSGLDPDATFSPTPIPLPSAITWYSENAVATDNHSKSNSGGAAERMPPDPTASILLDGKGCQAIYSPHYTAVCQTTVRMVGMPVATVTDCGQYVTFSSDTRNCKPAAETGDGGAGVGAGAEARNVGDDGYRGSTTLMSGPSGSAGQVSLLATITAAPGMHYAAHWVDLARGGVPPDVRVEECEVEGECQTFMERWSESRVTAVVTRESIVGFEGPAILTAGSSTITTTLSFSSRVTKTITTVSATIIRQRLGSEPSMSTLVASFSEGMTSDTAQETPQVTIRLVKLTPTTSVTSVQVAAAVQEEDQADKKDTEDGSGAASVDGKEDENIAKNGSDEPGQLGEPADGVLTVTVEETRTSTLMVYETRTTKT